MSVCPLEANLQMSSCPLEAVHTLGTYGHLTVRIVHGTYGHLTVPGTYGHLPVQTVPGTYGHLTVRTASMGHTDISLYEQCYSVTNQQTETTHIYIEIVLLAAGSTGPLPSSSDADPPSGKRETGERESRIFYWLSSNLTGRPTDPGNERLPSFPAPFLSFGLLSAASAVPLFTRRSFNSPVPPFSSSVRAL